MAETLTEVVQAALRTATGEENTYEGDWHAYATLQSIQEGAWGGRVLALAQAIDSTISTVSEAHNFFLLNPDQIGGSTLANIGAIQG